MIIFDMFFSPEAHDDPVDWSTALIAHFAVCVGLVFGLMLAGVEPVVSAAIVSGAYLVAWEGAQLRASFRKYRVRVALADGLLDAAGVALGCFCVAFAAMWRIDLAMACWASVFVVAYVGYRRRS